MPPSQLQQHLRAPSSVGLGNSCPEIPNFRRQCLPRPGRGCFANAGKVTMRDRSKNRRQLQKGRNLSIEAIQAVQALKRVRFHAGGEGGSAEASPPDLDRVMETKVRRLVKSDMMGALGELQQQNEAFLALQVFEEIRKEHWYKPKLSVYIDMITSLARNGMHEEVEHVCSYLKMETLQPDTEGFNALLGALLSFGFAQTTMDCFRLMKLWESEPDESTFRILIRGLESKGEINIASSVREEAQKIFGTSLDFLEDDEVTCNGEENPVNLKTYCSVPTQ